jgi:CheY-like chemotaxis protein
MEGMRVLVVDGNASVREALCNWLGNWHAAVASAGDALAALRMLKEAAAGGQPFRLALIDRRLPGIGGIDLAQQILKDDQLAATGTILLQAQNESVSPANSGIRAWLLKPVKFWDLAHAVTAASGSSSEVAAVAKPTPSLPEKPLRILLAEDNPVNQRLALRLLEKWGHKVGLANNGKEAVALAGREAFDVILMDLQMPEMGGFEAASLIRESERPHRRRVPIIALTACAMKGDREKCLELGMDGYVSKPIQFEELFSEIHRVCEPVCESELV